MLGALLGVLAAAQSPPLFEATATTMLTVPADPNGVFTPAALRALFRSPSMAVSVVSELALDRPPAAITPDRFLAQAFSVEDVPNTYLTRLRVRLPDAQLAAKAASKATEHLIEIAARVWRETLSHRRAELERQVEEARQGLASAEQAWLAARVSSKGPRLDLPRRLPFKAGGAESPPAERTFDERLDESRKRGVALAQAERRAAANGGAAALGAVYAREFELVRLENDVELRREIYMHLASRLEGARIELASMPKPLQLVEPPAVPDQPLPGTRRRTVAVGLLAGLVLAACVIVVREWRR